MHSPFSGSWRSINRRFPLVISGLLLGVLGAFTFATYRKVQQVLIATAEQRVDAASSVTAYLVGQSMARYRQQLETVAADPAVVGALSGSVPPSDTRRTIARLWAGETVPRARTEVLGLDGRVVTDTVWGSSPPQSGWIIRTIRNSKAPLETTVIGPFGEAHDSVYTESLVPIRTRDARVIGYIGDTRFVRSPGANAIPDLIGGRAVVLLGSRLGGVWGDFVHVEPAPPKGFEQGVPMVFSASARGAGVGAAHAIPGTTWLMWVEQPMDAVLTPTRSLLRQMGGVAILIIVLGAWAGWLLSRRVTAPLVALTHAAERIVPHPDRSAAASDDVKDEIGRLTDAFDRMASRVGQSLQTAEMARAEAESSNQAKAAFLASMSHELRTPLNAITGYAALLEDGIRGPLSPAQLNDVARIRSAAQHLLGLINDVLSFAKLDAGEVRVTTTDFSVKDLLVLATTMVEPQARAKSLALVRETIDGSLLARADREKTLQVVLNLLSNAIKFTRAGGRITLTADSADRYVRILVQDTGRGIRADQLQRVFEPFVQVGRQLVTPGESGVGLGLAISRDLARIMGGELMVDSIHGEGSTFALVLPRALEDAPAGDSRPRAPRAPVSIPAGTT